MTQAKAADPRRVRTLRMARALAIVALAVFAVPAIGAIQGTEAASASGDASAGLWEDFSAGWSDAAYDADLLALPDRIEQAARVQGSPPSEFADEAGFPPGALEARASADGLVVGCVIETASDEAFESVHGVLEEKGWSCLALQGVSGATFVKDSGRLRWMLVTCTQVGDATTVVYRMANQKEGAPSAR